MQMYRVVPITKRGNWKSWNKQMTGTKLLSNSYLLLGGFLVLLVSDYGFNNMYKLVLVDLNTHFYLYQPFRSWSVSRPLRLSHLLMVSRERTREAR